MAAEEVVLTGPPAIDRRDVGLGDLLGRAPRGPAGRDPGELAGLHQPERAAPAPLVIATHDVSWVEEHRAKPSLNTSADLLLGQEFGALVADPRLAAVLGRGLFDGLGLGLTPDRFGGGVHQATGPPLHGRGHDVARTLHVVSILLIPVAGPKTGVPRDVKDGVDLAGQRRGDRGPIVQATGHQARSIALELIGLRAGAVKDSHLPAALRQLLHDVAAQKARGPGDERAPLHRPGVP